MPTDPDSIPKYAVEIAQEAMVNAHLREHKPPKPDAWQVAIATALDTLMDDGLLHVIDRIDNRYAAQVRPSDVLAAVLARASDRPTSQIEHSS